MRLLICLQRSVYGRFHGVILLLFILISTFGFTVPNRAYVTVGLPASMGEVAVIDTTTNTIIQTIPGFQAPAYLAISPDGAFVYVADEVANSVSVINTATNTIIATIPGLPQVEFITITPDGKFVYAAGSAPATNVYVINTASNTLTTTIVTGLLATAGVAASPNGSFVYLVDEGAVTLLTISTATNTIIGSPISLGLGTLPDLITINSSGTRAYVSKFTGGVAVVDLTNNILLTSIPLATESDGMALTPDGKFLYITTGSGDTVVIADTATNTVVGSPIPVGNFPATIAMTPDGLFAYVVNGSDSTVSVINTTTNTVVGAPISLGGIFAGGILITPPPPSAPTNLTGVQKKGADSGLERVFFNVLTWQVNPNSTPIAGYFVYRNGAFLATLNASALQYIDQNSTRGPGTRYTVVAFSASGVQSNPTSIIIQ